MPAPVSITLGPREQIERIGTYTITKILGKGGMGVVYEAVRGSDTFALKTIEARFLSNEDSQAEHRFAREIRVLQSLEHPAVVRLFDFGVAEHPLGYRLAFFVMERLEGRSLEALLADQGHVPTSEGLRIVAALIDGLAYLATKNVVHRDIKPANVFLTEDRRVVLMDFGLARSAESTRLTRTGRVIGTLAYMSPEAMRANDVDGRSDVFSVGVLAYQMLTGRRPFEATSPTDMVRVIRQGFSWPQDVGLSGTVRQLINAMLAGDRERRPWASELKAELQAVVAAEGPPTQELVAAGPTSRAVIEIDEDRPGAIPAASDSRRWIVPVVTTALVVAFGLGVVVGRGTRPIELTVEPALARSASLTTAAALETKVSAATEETASGGTSAANGPSRDTAPVDGSDVDAPATAGPEASVEPAAAEVDAGRAVASAYAGAVSAAPAPPPVAFATFNNAQTAYRAGVEALDKADYDRAIDAFEQAIRHNPALASAHRRLADALLARRRRSDAVASYKVFLTLKPNTPDAAKIRAVISAIERKLPPPP